MNSVKQSRGPAWISGPDPQHHEMYVAFGYHRVTARLRGESWQLTWPQWRDIWLPHWQQRGRSAQNLCMSRKDLDGAWCASNVEIITRRQHGQRVRKHYS